jgi:phage terminase large subunit
VARYLLIRALQRKLRILCTREHQNSIQESVYRLFTDIIAEHKIQGYFQIGAASIKAATGSEFLFKGLAQNIESVKSTEGVDICWVEEAERVTERSWAVLIPTIRKPDSEIVVTFNPGDEQDATYQRFVVNTPENMLRLKVNHSDNPFFPDVLVQEMEALNISNPEKYLHIWEGHPRTTSEAQIFKHKFVSKDFKSPELTPVTTFYIGCDWGFGVDPTHVSRAFIRENSLYIDYDAEGYGLSLKDIPSLFRQIPGTDRLPIWCDCSRPETIAHFTLPENGRFDCRPAPKWTGSIEDGVEHLRQYDKIVIHPRCSATLWSFANYSYKIDQHTDKVLPIIVDKNNHGTDAVRYSLCTKIQRRATIFDGMLR